MIAPWREWDLNSRARLIEYAERAPDPDPARQERRAALLDRRQSAAHLLRGPRARGSLAGARRRRCSLRTRGARGGARRSRPTSRSTSSAGDPVAIDGEALSPAALLARLNELAGANGIGRLDLVENRFVGMKSRGVYETPGGTVLLAAHRAIESITLDRGAAHLKDELMPRYAELIYNGFWFSPERLMLQALIDRARRNVTGTVRLKLYKGGVQVVGRQAPQQPLRRRARDLRGRHRLRPARRRGLHQAERAAPARARPPRARLSALGAARPRSTSSTASAAATPTSPRPRSSASRPRPAAACAGGRSTAATCSPRAAPTRSHGPPVSGQYDWAYAARRCRALGRLLRRALPRARGRRFEPRRLALAATAAARLGAVEPFSRRLFQAVFVAGTSPLDDAACVRLAARGRARPRRIRAGARRRPRPRRRWPRPSPTRSRPASSACRASSLGGRVFFGNDRLPIVRHVLQKARARLEPSASESAAGPSRGRGAVLGLRAARARPRLALEAAAQIEQAARGCRS